MTRQAGRTPVCGSGIIRLALTGLWWHHTALLAVTAAAAAAAVVTPALLAAALDSSLAPGGGIEPVAVLAAVLVVGALSEAGAAWLSANCGGRATAGLRSALVAHLLRAGTRSPLAPGDAVARVTQASAVTAGAPAQAIGLGVQLIASLLALAALWWVDWRVGLAFVVAVPVAVRLTSRFMGDVTRLFTRYQEIQASVATRLVAALTGSQTIRASGTLPREIGRVVAPVADLDATGRAMWRAQAGAVWRFGLLVPITEVLVLIVAGWGVVAGRVSPGGLLAVVAYVKLALGGFELIDRFFELGQARSSLHRLRMAFAVPVPAEGRNRPGAAAGAVEWRRIRVAGVPATVNLTLPAGGSVALVGESGSGKSVLAGLLARLTDPEAGEVLLDGVPVDQLPLAGLRRVVAYAFDQPALLGATVHDTIAFGRPELSRARVVRAAQVAHADAFIRRLPSGYDTPLEQAPMSGGERQRLGLARAIARDALVNVLDDATSGLDTVTEAQVSEAVTTALAGRTRLVVAHRPATAARCDLVAWLGPEGIRAFAPHAELWRDPDYRAVFGVDAGDAVPAPREELVWSAKP